MESMDNTPVSLLLRLQRQDRAAWDRFVELFAPLLDCWVRRFGLSDADSADLVQDVFVILLRRLPTFQYNPESSFRAWLWTVIVNVWKDRLKKRSPKQLSPEDEPTLPETAEPVAEAEYQRYVISRTLQILHSDFEPKVWQAFWAVTLEERSPQEVSARLGISINSVYLARSRVLARLRQELAGLTG
jgi:RNA polymerase sigma-70 factor, ECF subfamily